MATTFWVLINKTEGWVNKTKSKQIFCTKHRAAASVAITVKLSKDFGNETRKSYIVSINQLFRDRYFICKFAESTQVMVNNDHQQKVQDLHLILYI